MNELTYNTLVGQSINWQDRTVETIVVSDRDWGEIVFRETDQGPVGLIDQVAGMWHGQSVYESWITVTFNLQTGEYFIADYTSCNTEPDLDVSTYDEVEYTIKYLQQKYGTTWNSLKFNQQLLAA
jgi:hypothetical protein